MDQFKHLNSKTIELGRMIKQRPINDIYNQAEKLIKKNII